MKYTHVVDAIQIKLTNFDEIREFCGNTKVGIFEGYRSAFGDTKVIEYCMVCCLTGVSIAIIGDYIVKNDKAGLTVYKRKDFEKLYTPVKEENNG